MAGRTRYALPVHFDSGLLKTVKTGNLRTTPFFRGFALCFRVRNFAAAMRSCPTRVSSVTADISRAKAVGTGPVRRFRARPGTG